MMLKSTHKSAPTAEPLPPNWSEHKAPTGHSYYYNSVTKKSTYQRPTLTPSPSDQTSIPAAVPLSLESFTAANSQLPRFQAGNIDHVQYNLGQAESKSSKDGKQDRRQTEDRPKKKQAIPGCAPWILVYTKLKRRFVFNPELNESFWKFPPHVMTAVIEMDRKTRERKERIERGESSDTEGEQTKVDIKDVQKNAQENRAETGFDSEEFEEVEVTDDEDEEEGPSKRPKLDEPSNTGHIEFDEEDIAYQLAAMGQDDNGSESKGWQEDYEEPELGEEDAKALFMDLLEDFHINPYTPWEQIVEDGKIIEDERYTCLPNMKSRKEAWDHWSRGKLQVLKEQREREEKKDPRVPYMSFLQKYASPKLYWAEFRRKYNKEAIMRDHKLKDKDREKWYREHINRLKLSERALEDDLVALLKSVPLSKLNVSTSLSALPADVLGDIRYISLKPKIRDAIVEDHIADLPPAPEKTGLSSEDAATIKKRKEERERREKALAERERRVQAQKKQQKGKLEYSKGLLREEEADVQRASKNLGKDGLLGHLEEKNDPDKDVT